MRRLWTTIYKKQNSKTVPFLIPLDFEAYIQEGYVGRIFITKGQTVKKGEPVIELETAKANETYNAEQDGVIPEIYVYPGQTVKNNTLLYRINKIKSDESKKN